jgi:putative FmdB family regulatory protein
MPIYVFECTSCEKITEEILPMRQSDKVLKCKCGSKMQRVLSLSNIVDRANIRVSSKRTIIRGIK